MRVTSRLLSVASIVGLSAVLAACGTSNPYGANNYPASNAPVSSYPSGSYPNQSGNYVEYGRVTNIEVVSSGSTGSTGNAGAGTIIGGVAGAVVGNQIGHGSGRAAATLLGALGGAVVGNQIDRNRAGSNMGAVYRVTLQTDNGAWRSYDVGATDLRIGERVRVENGQIFRM